MLAHLKKQKEGCPTARLFLGLCLFFSGTAVGAGEPSLLKVEASERIISLSGFTQPRRRFTLHSEVAGRCVKVSADIGESLGADGVFACLDDTFAQLDLQGNFVEQARLRTELAYYQKERQRLQSLVKKNTAAQSDLDRLTWKRDNTQQQIKARQVEEKRLREQLERFCIKAPAGLRVVQRLLEPGQWIGAGQAAAVLGDFNSLLVALNLRYEEYLKLRELPVIQLYLPELKMPVEARIAKVSPVFQTETRKILVELEITEMLPDMRGGLRARLDLDMPEEGVLRVPRQTVQEQYEEYFVTRADGEKINVLVLGKGPDNTLRITSPRLQADDLLLPQTPE